MMTMISQKTRIKTVVAGSLGDGVRFALGGTPPVVERARALGFAEVSVETIHNAWAAIPLYWSNQMDGRGPWGLEGSIREHQDLMAWYGKHHSAGLYCPPNR